MLEQKIEDLQNKLVLCYLNNIGEIELNPDATIKEVELEEFLLKIYYDVYGKTINGGDGESYEISCFEYSCVELLDCDGEFIGISDELENEVIKIVNNN